MRARAVVTLVTVHLCFIPAAGRAASPMANYVQNYEGLVKSSSTALSGDGWLVYGNVYGDQAKTAYLYGYGPFPAPNGTGAFCDIDSAQGGPDQGILQLSVYSDYNNADQVIRWIESNIYQERSIQASEVGRTWVFEFDAKRGNLAAPSTAQAFIKTLNPLAGYQLTRYITVNTTAIDTTWGHHSISLTIDAPLVGQLFQFGFSNLTTQYASSGILYDNVVVHDAVSTPVELPADGAPNPLHAKPTASVSPNPLNPAGVLTFRTSQPGPVTVKVFDLAGRLVRTLVEGHVLPAGTHRTAIDGRGAGGEILATGVYFCRVETRGGAATGRFTIMK
jgi:hypothetical protein